MERLNKSKVGLSLHIGLNDLDSAHYNGWSGRLIACENDATDMQAIAQSSGYDTTLFLGADATRKNIINFLSNAVKVLKENDILLVSFSGRGGKIPDFNADDPRSIDKTWCLFDSQLIDNELYSFWESFKKGVRILIVSDSCHSNTMIKSVINSMKYTKHQSKNLPDEISLNVYLEHKDFYDSINLKNQNVSKISATIRVLSACQDNQFAYDGSLNSSFTEKLKIVWNGGKFNKKHIDFHSAISELMPAYQSPYYLVVEGQDTTFDKESPFKI